MLGSKNLRLNYILLYVPQIRQQGASEMSAAYIQELEQLEAKAQEDGLGIWNKV
jgi:endonuclease YncB( thermonuclease family)